MLGRMKNAQEEKSKLDEALKRALGKGEDDTDTAQAADQTQPAPTGADASTDDAADIVSAGDSPLPPKPDIDPDALDPGTPPTVDEPESATSQHRLRIGEQLIAMGMITADQLEVALYEQQSVDKMLGEILVEMGFLDETALSIVLSESAGLDRFDPAKWVIEPEVVEAVPHEVAVQHRMLPLAINTGGEALVAMSDPGDVIALDQLRRYLPKGIPITPLVATPADLDTALDRAYGYELSIDGILAELSGDTAAAGEAAAESETSPVVRLVDAILLDAVKLGASDIHFEPEGHFLRLRYRIDGAMRSVRAFHRDHFPALAHRLKILGGMNIADKLKPQDGRFSMTLGSREVDFRVSSLPTLHGENVVLRVLDKTRSLRTLSELGFSEHNLWLIRRALLRPEGLVLVTGPTGAGKTTTLYAMLDEISTPDRNIMTLEDPVEYQIPTIRQTQVREGAGLDFVDGVRAMLRQNPDVVLIGEIRDRETAAMALRAAMTGHQVQSTLHTNDALGAVARLMDYDLAPGMLAGNIIAVIAQRLLRLLCEDCKTPREAQFEEVKLLGAEAGKAVTIYDAVGCSSCGGTGYRGRTSVAEVLLVDDYLDEVVGNGGNRAQLRHAANRSGFKPMIEDAAAKVLAGQISIEAMIRSIDVSGRI
ncbi:MAG: GspE/PulE family protein [Alphaproteobacteria bacterium]